jgi:dihydroxyacetone kinase
MTRARSCAKCSKGLVDPASNQALLERENVVIRAGLLPKDARHEVAVISGGGSGHEPAHAGYVGAGMLHAAVAGDVFTSPSVDAVLAAIRAVAGPPGVPSGVASLGDEMIKRAALAVAAALEKAEAHLTELDAAAGDGDLGASMTRGVAAIRALPGAAWLAHPSVVLMRIADALRRAIGGSSGPFYATALLRAAQTLPEMPAALDWSAALAAGSEAIAELGGAKPGDRTMLDALHPAATAFAAGLAAGQSAADSWREAVAAAQEGVAATAQMHPRLGRASYLGDRAIGTVDAGAAAVAIWMQTVWPLSP